MDWYYAEGGQQRGPVSEPEFEDLIRNGTIRNDTLVWRPGMSQWQRLDQTRDRLPAGPGEHVSGAGQPGTTRDELIGRDYTVDLGESLAGSWGILRENPGLVIGASALVFLALLGVNLVPYLGFLVSLILTGPLMGGLWWFFLRRVRRQPTSVGDAFSGFGPRFGHLVLVNIVINVATALCVLPGAGVLIGALVFQGFSSGGGSDSGAVLLLMVPAILLLLAGMLVSIYLNVSWLFALPLVIDKGLDFWPAMTLSWGVVKRRWWWTLLLAVTAGLLGLVGLMACGIGLLLTGPLAMGIFAHHYDRVFGDLRPGS